MRLLAVLLVLPVASCSSDDLNGLPTAGSDAPVTVAVSVDETVVPATPIIVAEDAAPRPVSRVVDANGIGADFVSDELIIASKDPEAVVSFAARRGADIVRRYDPPEGSDGHTVALVRFDLDGEAADAADIEQDITALAPHMNGSLRLSDAKGTSLLAIAARATREGEVLVAANWLLTGQSIKHRSVTEAPEGGDSANAFDWHYIKRGGAMDIGVGEAWRMMDAAGKFGNKVTIAVLDGGFMNSIDLPPNPSIYPSNAWNQPNAWNCTGGSPCPWHGTKVATAAFGVPDNNFGAVGPGGPIAKAVLVKSPSQDVLSILEYAFVSIPGAFGEGPRVVNISAGGDIPAGACIFACPALEAVSGLARLLGILVVASAGNDGKNVDEEDCFLGACWEEAATVPCELNSVICVGGLDWDSNVRDGGSNWGSDTGSSASVDIYAPYTVWVGPDPDSTDNRARTASGTSFSAPFTSGIAGLVWASKPSLSAGQVESILMSTAHTGGGAGAHHWVNAYAAVKNALGGNAPPYTRIDSPDNDYSVSGGTTVSFDAYGSDDEGAGLSYSWASNLDGSLGTGAHVSRSDLSVGTHQITVTVADGSGYTAKDTVSLQISQRPIIVGPIVDIPIMDLVIDTAPTASISSPLTGGWFEATYSDDGGAHAWIQLAGSADDTEDGRLDGPALTWTASFAGEDVDYFIGNSGTTWIKLYTLPCSSEDYEVTLNAQDSSGNTGAATILVNVWKGC